MCLAILSLGDATGYEIRKEVVEGPFRYFGEASFGSIYPALNRLTGEGLLTLRHEAQEGKPDRKVYSITDAGRAALVEELATPHNADTYKSPFLLMALFAPLLGAEVMRAAIARQKDYLNAELETLSKIEDKCDRDANCWARDFGVAAMKFSLNYLADHGDELIQFAEAGTEDLSSSEAAE